MKKSLKIASLISIVLLVIGVITLSAQNQSPESKRAKELEPFLKSVMPLVKMGDVMVEIPFHSDRKAWIPANYFKEYMFLQTAKQNDDGGNVLIMRLIYPEFEGKNEENVLFFRSLDYPEKVLNFRLEAHIPEAFQIQRHEILTNRLFGKYGDLNEEERFKGDRDKIQSLEKQDIELKKIGKTIREMYKAGRTTDFWHWLDRGERYGLQWVSDRFPVGNLDNGDVYYGFDVYRYGDPIENRSRFRDDIYYSYGEDGEVNRIINCPPEEQQHTEATKTRFGLVPYCDHVFLYPKLDARIELRYYRDNLSDWENIENKVISILDGFLQKPDDKAIVSVNDDYTLLKLMQGEMTESEEEAFDKRYEKIQRRLKKKKSDNEEKAS